jgi:hypothetical protein
LKVPEKLPSPPVPDQADTKQLKANAVKMFRKSKKYLANKNKGLM